MLFQGIGNYFQKLKSFTLDFSYSELITNAGVEIIIQKISRHFRNLKKFELIIVGCESIEYQNLEDFSERLSFIPEFEVKKKHPF